MPNYIEIIVKKSERLAVVGIITARIKIYGDCWVWTGAKGRRGYGNLRWHSRTVQVHRLSYVAWVGRIPKGLTLDHLCKNTACVNPAHLEPVTIRENILRGDGLAAQNARKEVCQNGHPYDEKNTHVRMVNGKPQGRYCSECKRIESRRSMRRLRIKVPLKRLGGFAERRKSW
jgi:HNH endonuclease